MKLKVLKNMKKSSELITIFLSADHFALHASLPPALPHRPGRRPVQCALERLPDLHLPGDFLHRGHSVPEHLGQFLSLQTQNANCWQDAPHITQMLTVLISPHTDHKAEDRSQPLCKRFPG